MTAFGHVNHRCPELFFFFFPLRRSEREHKTLLLPQRRSSASDARTLGRFYVFEGARSETTAAAAAAAAPQRFSIKIPASYFEQELIRTVNAGRGEGQCVPAAL